MTDRSLFHSFPRPRSGETPSQTVERGLAILRYMLDVGLVLAPELVTWHHHDSEPTILLQRRICFTELSLSELPEHSKTFGPFALQCSPANLRGAGAMPVIYAPQAIDGHPASGVAAFCVKAATHTKYVLERVEELKKVALELESGRYNGMPDHREAVITLRNEYPKGHVVSDCQIKAADLAGMMRYLGFRNVPFDHSIGMLGVYENMFYPTDNAYTDDQLGYYRQREWRLVGPGIAVNGHRLTRALDAQERARLETIDRDFWTRELTVNGGSFSRSTLAQIYSWQVNSPLSDIVEKIILPASAEASVRALFAGKVQVM